ncbi:hypothetical protein VPHK567_0046 [Vibrio phage K567]
MLYINLTTCSVLTSEEAHNDRMQGHDVQSRWDWSTLAQVTDVCNMLDQEKYMVVETNALPKYDIIEKPRVGDDVSYSFNGDSRPDGQIKSISKTMKMITTTTGNKYYRRGQSATWKRSGTWTLVGGHHNKTNMEF